jgi:hypothetical protein
MSHGRNTIAWATEKYLTHAIRPILAHVGGHWIEDYHVYDADGQYVAAFGDMPSARRAICDSVDVLATTRYGYTDLSQYL